jgi:cytochrome c oxidase subunit 2
MQYIIQQASSYAADIDNLILLVTVLAGFWFILAEIVLFYFIFKFRKKPGQKAQYITGEQKHEKKWIHIPHNLILVCDVVIIIFAVKVWHHVKQEMPPIDETIRVVGHQWAWRFVHPGLDKQLGTADDVETVDELRVKLGKTYQFQLESADVLHSFSVPVFRLKQDAIPGRVITGWFKPTAAGTFDLQCAEICGIGHGLMRSSITVESEEDHIKWLQTKTTSAH